MKPKISITIPVKNEEKFMHSCLDAIKELDYPKSKIEVLIIDAGSTDRTIEISSEYSFVKIIENQKKDTHIGKMLGLQNSTGEFWVYFDADLQPNGKNWANAMVKPLIEDESLTASVSRYHAHEGDSWIENYINLDPIGRDTLFAWFTPSIQSTIIEEKHDYSICQYEYDAFPPEGRCLFRREMLMKYIGKNEMFRELDTIKTLIKEGHDKYAYVPEPGYYHRHPQSLKELRRKRKRNTQKNYIPGSTEGYIVHKWFDLKKPKDALKMFLLILYAFSIIGPLLGGLYKTIKHRNIGGMVETVYVPVAVGAYLEAFLTNNNGRLFIKNIIKEYLRID